MFSVTNSNNQQPQVPMPENTRPKFEMTPRKRFSFSRVPIVAQISGLLSLLVIGAGLLTVNQLSQTSQDLQSQAATGDVQLEFNQQTATLALEQEKSFFIVATPSNNTMKISAAVVRLRNEDEEIAAVTSITPIVGILPVVLKPFGVEVTNAQITQHAITIGADPLKPFSGKKNLVEVKIKAKNKAGKANIEIAQNSEIAAFDNAGNVMKKYDLSNTKKQFLVIDVQSSGGGTGAGDICVSKTASKVVGTQKTPLAANAKVKPGDVIEYAITIGTRSDTTKINIDDRFPTGFVEYVAGSAKLNGATVAINETEIKKNILLIDRDVAVAARGKQAILTYQVKVKAGITGGEFSNHASVKLNNNNAMSDICELNLGVQSGTTPPQANACTANTASLVTIANGSPKLTPLAANAKVKRGDTIEYKFTIKPPTGSTKLTFRDQLPDHVEYVRNSAKIDNASPGSASPYNAATHQIDFSVNQPAGNTNVRTVTYQAKVVANAPNTGTAANFSNSAQIIFNDNVPASVNNKCSIGLSVSSTPTSPSPAPSVSPSPAPSGSPSPVPPTTSTPKLTVKLQIQGVLTSGVTETGELALRYTNPQKTTEKVIKKYPITLTSGANGIFTSNKVVLTDFPTSSVGGIEVFVKTPVTLRKKLATTERTAFSSTTGELVIDKSQEVLFAGDFDRTQGQENFFRILDVSAMLSQYKRVSNPVTAANKEYDLDKNNVINILDVSIILSNYTKTSVAGETL